MVSQTADVPTTAISPASRASWIGRLQLGQGVVPVRAYAAAVTSRRGPLRQLHAGCGRQIEQRRCCPLHGELPSAAVGRGFAYAAGELLELSESELASLEPEDDRTIHVEQCFDPQRFDLLLLSGRSFHLLPAHAAAAADCAAIAAALRQANLWGYGRMVLSGHCHQLVLQPADERLQLHVLHCPADRRSCPASNGSVPADPDRIEELAAGIVLETRPVSWNSDPDDRERRLVELVRSRLEQRSRQDGGQQRRTSGGRSRRTGAPRAGEAA